MTATNTGQPAPLAEVSSSEIVRALAVVEVMFRGKWTPIYEVAEWKAEAGWNMTLSEPIKQIRVTYLK